MQRQQGSHQGYPQEMALSISLLTSTRKLQQLHDSIKQVPIPSFQKVAEESQQGQVTSAEASILCTALAPGSHHIFIFCVAFILHIVAVHKKKAMLPNGEH